MIMLDDTTALVSSTDDLRDAVSSDNGVESVYLDADITLTYGITIYPNKATLTIDGTYDGVIHTFTDMESSDYNQTLGIRADSSIHLIFRNIVIAGRNFFGIPYVNETVNTDRVTVSYINMSYTGKQVIFHQRGLTRFINCNIIIAGQPSSQFEEVGQICKVEIGGQTTIQKTNNEDSVFWFYGLSTRKPYLKILAGANVTITTAHYFMYESYPPDYIIESGATFTLHTNSGISYSSAHTVDSFLVDKNASFSYSQSTNRGYASLYLNGALTVNEGANFYMQADFANTNRLIRFTGSSSRLYLNNPRSFALYNRGNASATAFSFAALTPFVFIGNQINYWEFPALFPTAGTFDDLPMHKWKKTNWNSLKIEGRADNSQTYIDFHDFTQEELEQTSALADLKLHLPKVFSVGNLPLTVNAVVIGVRPISGKTAKKAKVRVSAVSLGPYPDCDAGDDGLFSVAQTNPVPFSEIFTVTSNIPFLLTTLAVESQEDGELLIFEAPEYIQFITPPMAEFSDIILPRQIPVTTVIVSDTRVNRTPWVIWVKITGPLQTAEYDVLDDAVIFVHEEGNFIMLSTELVPIHTDGPYPDENNISVTWDYNKGVLARINVPIRSGRRYSTQMQWAVYPVGIQPEEELWQSK